MTALVYYDIAENRRRGKVAKALKTFGAHRLQKSVWLYTVTSKGQAKSFAAELRGLMVGAPSSDCCIITTVSKDALVRSIQLNSEFPFAELISGSWLVI